MGSQSITAAYSGNANYAASSSSILTQSITPATTHLIVTGPDVGDTTDGPLVRVFDATTGNLNFSFLAYDKEFLGAVRVAMGDFNGDGTPDIVTATGSGGVPLVNVYDGKTGAMFAEFYAYSANYLGGVEIAVADVTGSGHADIITSTAGGGQPLVNVFNWVGTLLGNFYGDSTLPYNFASPPPTPITTASPTSSPSPPPATPPKSKSSPAPTAPSSANGLPTPPP